MLRVVSIILNRRKILTASNTKCHNLRPVEASTKKVNLTVRNVNLWISSSYSRMSVFSIRSFYFYFYFYFFLLSIFLYWCLAQLPLRCPTPGTSSHQFLICCYFYVLPSLSGPILARTSPNPSCYHAHKSGMCQVQAQPRRSLWSGTG